jgi:monoamine oxidase
MLTASVAVVGGGLSGLYAAFRLQQTGIKDYVLLEARSVLGGRILSVPANGDSTIENGVIAGVPDRLDLGPTWFWPALQPQLDNVLHDLGLSRFEQHLVGDTMVERSRQQAPERVRGYADSVGSMRLAGGMASLIDTLAARLDAANIRTGETVRALRHRNAHVEVESEDSGGNTKTLCVKHVLFAVPPRLAEANIEFSPALPPPLVRQWRSTATWMAPHAKYVASYETPFWRAQGLSGEARSACGPLVEMHDASMQGGSAALFGFFGIPANIRARVPDDTLRAHCRAQLVRLFGPLAEVPKADFIKDWARDPYTATADDIDGTLQHLTAAAANASQEPWSGCLTGIASEWSAQFPGYIAGAVEAAAAGVDKLVSRFDDRDRIRPARVS